MQDNFLGNDSRRRKRHGDILGFRAAFLDQPADRICNLVKFFDVAVGDPPPLERLNRTALEYKISSFISRQFYQLYTGRADVYA